MVDLPCITPRDTDDIRAEWTMRALFLDDATTDEAIAAGEQAVTEYDNALAAVFLSL